MDRLLMLPFLIGGILIIIFHRRLAAAFQASNRSFYDSLIGKERADRLRGAPDSRRSRIRQAYTPIFLIVFGLFWIGISLVTLLGVGN
jgi:hypothetical protein